MRIAPITHLSTVDYPGKLSAVVFLSGCNLLCHYCQNPGLVSGEDGSERTTDDILTELRSSADFIDAVTITGGEPLLQELRPLLQGIKDMGLLVKLDTNGTLPEKLDTLIDLVDYVAIDVKAPLEEALYEAVIGKPYPGIVERVRRSKEIARRRYLEARTTVLPRLHTLADLRAIAGSIRAHRLTIQQFRAHEGTLDPSFADERSYSREELLAMGRAIASSFPGEVYVRTEENGLEQILS